MSQAKSSSDTPFRYVHSANFPQLLEGLGATLAVTTYQAGKLMLVRAREGRLNTLLRSFERPMGLAVRDDLQELAVGTRRMIWTLRSEPQIAPQLDPPGAHDACFVPRRAHVTGGLETHEIAYVGGEPWAVNTRFSCLCKFDDVRYGFTPVWRPPFIDQLKPEDHCHLNGIAVDGGQARFVTVMGLTDTPGGWRKEKHQGGAVLDVATGEPITQGLCMPHSPRVYEGKLYVLDSGRGTLATVDLASGKREDVAAMPGFTRGLAFQGRYAFVGLSQVREKRHFDGLPIGDQYGEDGLRCGVSAVDLESGEVVAFLQFEAGCQEIFDIQMLPGLRWPALLSFEGDQLDSVVTAPPDAWK